MRENMFTSWDGQGLPEYLVNLGLVVTVLAVMLIAIFVTLRAKGSDTNAFYQSINVPTNAGIP